MDNWDGKVDEDEADRRLLNASLRRDRWANSIHR